MTQRLKVVPSSVAYDIAGDYFQALRHITAPAALVVQHRGLLPDPSSTGPEILSGFGSGSG